MQESPDKKAWQCFLEEIDGNPVLADIADEVRSKLNAWTLLDQVLPGDRTDVSSETATEMIALAVRTRQRLKSAAWQGKGATMDAAEFKKLPRNTLKVWQEVLSHPADRQSVGHLEEIVIDPSRVSRRLFEAADLARHYPDKRALTKVERLETHAAQLDKITQFLASLEPLRDRDALGGDTELSRFYRIPEDYSMAGMMIGIQGVNGQKRVFVTDLVSVQRRFHHIRDGYRHEREQLMYIRSELIRFDELLASGKDVSNAELGDGKKKLMDIVSALEHVTNEDKKQLRDIIRKILTVKDARQRFNPGVARNAIHFKTGPLSEARLAEMVRIARHLEGDEQFLQTLVASQIPPFGFFRQKVEDAGNALHITNPKKPLTPQQISRLERLHDYFGGIKFEPFQSMAVRIQGYIRQALEGVHQDTKQSRFDAKHAFLRAYLIAKIEDIFWQLQNIYTRIETGLRVEIYLKGELDKIRHLRQTARARVLAPDTNLPDFKPFFDELDALLGKLIKDLSLAVKIYKQSNCDYENNRGIKACLESAQETMKEFDFNAWIRRLPYPAPDLQARG